MTKKVTEQVEYAIIGDGITETVAAAILNVHGKKTALIKQTTTQKTRKPYHDASDFVKFEINNVTYRAQFDPLQRPERCQSLIIDTIFIAQLSAYLTLEKCSDPFILADKLFKLPTDKSSLLKSSFTLIEKRNLLKFMVSMQNLIMNLAPNYYMNCAITQSTQVLSNTEQEIKESQPNFKELLAKFQLSNFVELCTFTFDLQPDTPFLQSLRSIANFFASKARFDDNGSFVIHQYGWGDVLQCFERLIYVYNGLSTQESGIIDGNSFKSDLIDLEFQKKIVFKHEKCLYKHYFACSIENSEIQKFNLDELKNQIVLNKDFKVIIRRGNGQQLSKGLVSFNFYEFESVQKCKAWLLGMGLQIHFERDFEFKSEDDVEGVEVPPGFGILQAFMATENLLLQEGLISERHFSEDMDIRGCQEALQAFWSKREIQGVQEDD